MTTPVEGRTGECIRHGNCSSQPPPSKDTPVKGRETVCSLPLTAFLPFTGVSLGTGWGLGEPKEERRSTSQPFSVPRVT